MQPLVSYILKNLNWRSALLVLVINLGITLAIWLCIEMFFGAFIERRGSSLAQIQFAIMTSREFTVADSDRGFRLRKNFSSSTIHTNSQGFRGKEIPKVLTNQRLVLALGESTTFGWGVGDDESYPSQLERILNSTSANKPFVVVNAGIPSYSSRQVFLYADQLLTRLQPDVVIVSILWNDLFYSSIEEWKPQSLVPPYPSGLQQILFKYSHVYRWSTSKSARPELVNFYSKDAVTEYQKNIESILTLCKSKGIPVIFVEPPFSAHLIPKAGLTIWETRLSEKFVPEIADLFLAAQLQELESRQVPFVRHLLGISKRPTPEYFSDFLHTNVEGNRIIAQRIADFLHDDNLLAERK